MSFILFIFKIMVKDNPKYSGLVNDEPNPNLPRVETTELGYFYGVAIVFSHVC